MANPDHFEILNKGFDAWNQWRQHYVGSPNLSGADLGRRNLHAIDFSGAHLADASFTEADLSEANFSGADLRGVSFFHANLRNSNLLAADLSGIEAGGADFNGAMLGYTVLANNDLAETKGLESVKHNGPSSIGIDTLYRSQGRIPDEFLRGAGVPQEMIDFARTLRCGPPIQWHSCFISYSTQDGDFAKRLHARMRQANLRVWFAPEHVKGGKKLHEQLFDAIQLNDKLLLVLSPHSIQSQWVMTEIRKAREVERKENRRKLFPIRLVDFDTLRTWTCFDADTGKDLAVEVREYFIPDFSNWEDHDSFEAAFARLQNDLRI